MDLDNKGYVEKNDYVIAVVKDPDLLEVFDFLNKGFTDTINPNIRNRELTIARDLQMMEKAIEKL